MVKHILLALLLSFGLAAPAHAESSLAVSQMAEFTAPTKKLYIQRDLVLLIDAGKSGENWQVCLGYRNYRRIGDTDFASATDIKYWCEDMATREDADALYQEWKKIAEGK